ncbi:molybdopterin cofactor-binding domain-containing protein [Sporichthya polymorpha]|uniref:molybdopterin cofactor-binding domain-containing protein n=1 Tax=Sporichthya polymorpha TaxID=35751 RepID=UPI00039F8913|nr:molybdopterin cofactor-binding domain-containing protein [Sporichthya polymorpha]
MTQTADAFGTTGPEETANGLSRRRFVGYVMAGTTLTVAGQYVVDSRPATAAGGATPILSNDLPSDHYDFMDLMRDQTRAVTPLLTLEVSEDGRVRFDMPRCEVGQGVETGVAQIIADQMEIPYEQVDITQSKARADLFAAQLTGGSSSLYSLWEPLRELSELARQRLVGAAAQKWNVSPDVLRTKDGFVFGPDGQRAPYGSLAIGSPQNELVGALLDAAIGPPKGGVIGKSVPRKDIKAIVTGAKKFAMDLDIPNALPTMLARPPTFNGRVGKINNLEQIKGMPGVTDVAVIESTHRSSAVAIRAKTFGQCVDAIRALKVDWEVGDTGKVNSEGLMAEVQKVRLPMEPALPGSEVIEGEYTFQFRSNSPLETNSAVADVTDDKCEVWAASKIPGTPLGMLSEELGLPLDKVVINVVYAGGSFGRKLHGDHILEAARASKAFGKPVRLMWHRTDDIRHGRQHPGAISHVRATKVGNSVTSFTQWHASGACDFTHSLGDVISGRAVKKEPGRYAGNTGVTDYFYQVVTSVPYNFGPTKTALTEAFQYDYLPTSAVRNVYSPDVAVARELLVEDLAESFGMDGYEFRRAFAKSEHMKAALDAVAERGNWGRKMPAGMAQAIAIHSEYKCNLACLMEIDNRPETTRRRTRRGWPGPRITKAIFAGAMGVPVNPDQCKAQFMGGMIDGIAAAFTEALHWEEGLPIEGGWDDYMFTRQWMSPLEFEAIVIDDGSLVPSGTGETGNGAGYAAAAIALQKVLGRKITELPVYFRDTPSQFTHIPKSPSVPQSPTRVLPS